MLSCGVLQALATPEALVLLATKEHIKLVLMMYRISLKKIKATRFGWLLYNSAPC